MPTSQTIDKVNALFDSQLGSWPLASRNFAALAGVKVRDIRVGECTVRVQFNPARIVSTGAKVDTASLKARPCFLCAANRPAEQEGVSWGDGRYEILVNPFPIFPRHLTIPATDHCPQRIAGRVADMVRLALELPGYTVFYNGPRCGASAPDHCHFQAGNSDFLGLDDWLRHARLDVVAEFDDAVLSRSHGLPVNVFVIDADSPQGAARMFDLLVKAMPLAEGDEEPMMNVLCHAIDDSRVRLAVIPRRRHRPTFYGDAEGLMLVSPASVDLAGVVITPLERDFDAMDATWLRQIFEQTCSSEVEMDAIADAVRCSLRTDICDEPTVTVGIMAEESVDFILDGSFALGDLRVTGPGHVTVAPDGTGVVWNGEVRDSLTFEPVGDDCAFELVGVTIGMQFHWQRKENQRFRGALTLRVIDGKVTAINRIKVEDYLLSVISSEMSATASLELLKAHAVISRSWLLAQIDKTRRLKSSPASCCNAPVETETERIRWYDRDDHEHFDVCADDHCQRYQGITRASTPAVAEAIAATRGEVLMAEDDTLCDARFSKCCGGVFEEFENCWEPVHHYYLEARADNADEDRFPDLTIERNAEEWILSRPESFCNTTDSDTLSQVLNNYDRETTDFYRWKVSLTRQEIARLVRERSGIDFGEITDLIPVERGTSGRLSRLEIVGTRRRMVIGKELEIRRTLSPTHLYSSAFVVERHAPDPDGIPSGFTFHGAGWGHGVGLCQIGAAVMGARGYDYRSILLHYFKNANITQLYS